MKQVKLYGIGGQGVVTAAKIFAEAVAIEEGKYAQAVPAYGHERRGAPVYSDVMISDEPIKLKSFVYNPDYVVIFDLSVIDKGVDVMKGATPETIFIINSECLMESLPFYGHKTYFVGARRIAVDVIKRDIPNSAMCGAIAGAGLVGIDAMKAVVTRKFKKVGEINATAAQQACDELQCS